MNLFECVCKDLSQDPGMTSEDPVRVAEDPGGVAGGAAVTCHMRVNSTVQSKAKLCHVKLSGLSATTSPETQDG